VASMSCSTVARSWPNGRRGRLSFAKHASPNAAARCHVNRPFSLPACSGDARRRRPTVRWSSRTGWSRNPCGWAPRWIRDG